MKILAVALVCAGALAGFLGVAGANDCIAPGHPDCKAICDDGCAASWVNNQCWTKCYTRAPEAKSDENRISIEGKDMVDPAFDLKRLKAKGWSIPK